MSAHIFDDRLCFLGEGPLWHPERQQLFWFDIIGRTLLTRKGGDTGAWTFDDMVSAAGWIDRDTLLVSSETALIKLNLETRSREIVAKIDIGEGLRTNDGRADPWGGFWFSSMGKKAEKDAGAIYRYYRGDVTKLFSSITIPNSICFTPDRRHGYFADTDRALVKRVDLDSETGAPVGEPEIYLDLSTDGLNPDGAIIDTEGNMWLAQWGASRVAVYDPSGTLLKSVAVGAPHASCPAFGGADLTTLYCTTAREGLDAEALAEHPESGNVFFAEGVGRGQSEPAVIV
ncbi:SMP-30/gluconolactonase/LRE family protein [Pelagibacterium sp.]|uniref:SMP-30/gluconolactonase/LRE family protein n=1 Tax=Pelagibacterium sp. TaxID=1967288 RepID=UPI003A8C8C8F